MNEFKIGDRVEIITIGIYLHAPGTIEKICDDGGYDILLDFGRTVHVYKESIRLIEPISPAVYKTAELHIGTNYMQKENKRSERVKDEELLDKLSEVRYGTSFEKLSSHEVKIVNAMYDGCMKILDDILTLTGVEVE